MKLKTIVAESPIKLDDKFDKFEEGLKPDLEIKKVKFKETEHDDCIYHTAYILYEVKKE